MHTCKHKCTQTHVYIYLAEHSKMQAKLEKNRVCFVLDTSHVSCEWHSMIYCRCDCDLSTSHCDMLWHDCLLTITCHNHMCYKCRYLTCELSTCVALTWEELSTCVMEWHSITNVKCVTRCVSCVIIWHMWTIDMCGSYVRWGIDVCDGMTLNNTCQVCLSMCVMSYPMAHVRHVCVMSYVSCLITWHMWAELSTCVIGMAFDCLLTMWLSQHVTITSSIDHNHIVNRQSSVIGMALDCLSTMWLWSIDDVIVTCCDMIVY